MVVGTERCPVCGQEHGGRPCQRLLILADDTTEIGCCNSRLPDPRPEWVACAYCGLAQLPGKRACDYCGHLWKSAPAG